MHIVSMLKSMPQVAGNHLQDRSTSEIIQLYKCSYFLEVELQLWA